MTSSFNTPLLDLSQKLGLFRPILPGYSQEPEEIPLLEQPLASPFAKSKEESKSQTVSLSAKALEQQLDEKIRQSWEEDEPGGLGGNPSRYKTGLAWRKKLDYDDEQQEISFSKVFGEAADYLKRSGEQVLKGNYSDEVTLLGTLGQIALGMAGLDTPADIRDLTYDLTHWEWTLSHIAQTLLDALGLIPGIGALKNADEAGALLKGLFHAAGTTEAVRNLFKYGDEAGTALLRHGDELGDTLKKAASAILKTADDLPGDEVAKQIAKYWDEGAEAVAAAAKKGADKADELADALSDTLDVARKTEAIAEGAGDVGKIITEIRYRPSSGAILKANPNKTTTILGSFAKDMKNIINEMGNVKSAYFGPQKGGFNILNVPDDMYKNADQFWNEVNVKWLDQAIARGDDFVLATKPTADVLWKIDPVSRTKTLTGFGREYRHMLDNGYAYDSLSNMMIKR